MGDLLAALVQRHGGVAENTKDKEYRVWKRWSKYATAIRFSHDVCIVGAFMAALQQRQFSRPNKKCLVATVQETMAKVGEAFRSNVGHLP